MYTQSYDESSKKKKPIPKLGKCFSLSWVVQKKIERMFWIWFQLLTRGKYCITRNHILIDALFCFILNYNILLGVVLSAVFLRLCNV